MDSRLGEGTSRCQTVCPWAVRWADALGAVPGRPWDGIWHTGDVIGHTRDVLGRSVDGRIVPRTSTGQWTHYGRSRLAQRWLTLRILRLSHVPCAEQIGLWSRLPERPASHGTRLRRLRRLVPTVKNIFFKYSQNPVEISHIKSRYIQLFMVEILTIHIHVALGGEPFFYGPPKVCVLKIDQFFFSSSLKTQENIVLIYTIGLLRHMVIKFVAKNNFCNQL